MAGRVVAEEGAHQNGEGAAAHVLGNGGQVWELPDAGPGHQLLGQRGQELGPGVPELGRALERKEQRAGVDLLHGVDVELDRRHDAEVAPAATQRPEQVGLMDGVRAHGVPVGRDELDRADAIRLEAVLAAQPAHAAAERVPGDAHVGRGTVKPGQAERRELGRDLLPLDAAAHAYLLSRGVDRDAVELRRVGEDRAVERAERYGVVAGGLRSDLQALLAGVVHHRDDVSLVDREGDGLRPEIGEHIEGLAGLVPVGVAGGDNPTGHEVGEAGGCRTHLRLLSVDVSVEHRPGAARAHRGRPHPPGTGIPPLSGTDSRRGRTRAGAGS
jgi:hypothetical protein